jgi:hypothetical protein
MSDTLATVASSPAPAADPGELGPAIAPAAAPKPAVAEHAQTYEQRRHAQDAANAAAKPEAAADGKAKPAEAAADPKEPPAEPGQKFRVGRHEVSEEQITEMLQRQSQEDLKRATLPQSAEGYEAKLPEGLKLPGGIEYSWNNADPTMVAARNWAHAKGLSQGEFSEVLGIYANHIATEQAAIAERSRLEIAKAGVNAPQRVDAVGKFITGLMGETDAKQIKALIVTDSMLRYHEAIMNKLASQGAANFSQSHRVAPETGGIPGYDKMTFEQRRQAQDINASRRR